MDNLTERDLYLILQLIEGDLRQHRLQSLLLKAGLETYDFDPFLCYPIFTLMGFTDEETENIRLYELYLNEKEKCVEINKEAYFGCLNEQAERIFRLLNAFKSIEK